MTLRCDGCGHNFYNDKPMADGRCKWCNEEDDDKCHICGSPARYSGWGGYLCASVHCEFKSEQTRRKQEEENYNNDLI